MVGRVPSSALRTPPLSSLSKKEPQTDWKQLAAPLEGDAQKTARFAGQVLSFLSIPLAGVAVFRPHKMFTPRVFTIVALVSLVSGAILWYVYSPDDQQQLLNYREEVKQKIQSTPLSTIRETYPDQRVISDLEIDQWMKYFLETQTFTQFMLSQKTLPPLSSESTTRQLIKQKYLHHAKHPSDSSNLDSYPAVFKAFLVGDPEGDLLAELRTEKSEVLKVAAPVSYASYYQQFFKEGGLDALKRLSVEMRPLYAWLFTIYIWQLNVGIAAIEHSYSEVLVIFGKAVKESLFCYIAEREAEQVTAEQVTYDKFFQRNGVKGIGYIANQSIKSGLYIKFKKYVLEQDFGWLATKAKFSGDIQAFGADFTEGLDEAILEQEWARLELRTYTQFRERMGLEQIEKQEDPGLLAQMKEMFLTLPPAELVKPEYEKDRLKLKVLELDIKHALRKRWAKMTLKQILVSDREVFINSFLGSTPLLEPKQLTEEAVRDVRGLPIADVLRDYADLFEVGILKVSDADFTTQLTRLSVDVLGKLIAAHGNAIFRFEFIKLEDPKIVYILKKFIFDHADGYLDGRPPPTEGIGKVIAQRELIPRSCSLLLEEAGKKKVAEEKLHQSNLRDKDRVYDQGVTDANIAAREALDKLTGDLESLRLNHSQLNIEVATHQASLEAFEAKLSGLKSAEAEAKKSVDRAKKTLKEVQSKKEELDVTIVKITQHTANREGQREAYEARRKGLEDTQRESSQYKKTQGELEADLATMSQLEEQRKSIMEMATKRDQLIQFLSQPPTTIDKPEVKDERFPADRTASKPSTQTATGRQQAEEELRMINNILKLDENKVDLIDQKVETLKSSIQFNRNELESLAKIKTYDSSLSSTRDKYRRLDKEITTLQTQRDQLADACKGLAALEEEYKKLEKAKKELTDQLDAKRASEKRGIQSDYDQAVKKRDDVKKSVKEAQENLQKNQRAIEEIHAKKISSLEREKQESKDAEQRRYQGALQKINREAKEGLGKLVPNKPQ